MGEQPKAGMTMPDMLAMLELAVGEVGGSAHTGELPHHYVARVRLGCGALLAVLHDLYVAVQCSGVVLISASCSTRSDIVSTRLMRLHHFTTGRQSVHRTPPNERFAGNRQSVCAGRRRRRRPRRVLA